MEFQSTSTALSRVTLRFIDPNLEMSWAQNKHIR